MAAPLSSTCGSRPAYLDSLFRDSPFSSHQPSPSVHSINSTSSTSSSYAMHTHARPLSPAWEESDTGSIRSFKPNFSPRFHVRNIFHRRTPPPPPNTRSFTPAASNRRPSLPRLQTSFTSPSTPPRKGSIASLSYREKPLPTIPAQELKCHRCYYFAARNCNGWVMGGAHGDACEQCLQAGFFGAP